MQSAALELDTEPLAEGGFATAGRAGYEHQTHLGIGMETAVDFLGNLHYLLLLQGLRHLNQFACTPLLAGHIHISHIVQLHNGVPAYVFCEHIESLGLLEEGSELVGMMPVRNHKQETVAVFP